MPLKWMAMAMTRARRWTLRLLTAGLSLVVVFTALEIGLRLMPGTEAAPTFQALFMSDPVIGYRLRPGARMRFTTSEFTTDIRINSAGVRDEELGAKGTNERRLVILGDSMVMGVQVPLEETFAKQLERRLNGIDRPLNSIGIKGSGLNSMSGGPRYRVINAGVQGYGTVEEYLFLKEMIDTLQPDLVLLTVFVGNDAVEAGDAEWRLTPSPQTARQKVDTGWRWGRRLARRSATVQFLRQKFLTVSSPSGNAPLRDRPLDSYLEPAAPDVMHGFAVAGECVTRIASLARTHGASTAIVLLPARFQIDEADFTRLSDAVTRPGRTLVRDAATDRFRAVLDMAGPPVLDLLPVFRARPDAPDLFFRENVHLTARGHQVVAEALVQFIQKHGLVGGPDDAPSPPSSSESRPAFTPNRRPRRGPRLRIPATGPAARATLSWRRAKCASIMSMLALGDVQRSSASNGPELRYGTGLRFDRMPLAGPTLHPHRAQNARWGPGRSGDIS